MSALILTFIFGVVPLHIDSTKMLSQDSAITNVYIDAVFIVGNKKTKNDIITRELSIKKGETYHLQDLERILEGDRSKLLNTQLFNTVDISILNLSETVVDIVVNVTERWYTFPAPIFSLVDRNFNDWWQNQNRDLSRTNFGVKIFRNNFRGRNEKLKLLLQLGFTQQFGINYQIPYIDKRKRHGLSFSYDYSENKNIAVRTVEHKPVFFDSEDILRVRKEYSVGYRYRRSFYNWHSLRIAFNDNTVNDTVLNINPEYYQEFDNDQQYAELIYFFTHDKRDNASYPLKGNRFTIRARKQGLGFFDDINRFDFLTSMSRFFDLKKDYYFSNYSSVYFSLPEDQPYSNFGALGFKKDFIRGYELFQIEGKSFYLNRSTLKKKVFSRVARLGAMPIEQFKNMPIDIYLKVYFDMGYVENFENYEFNQNLADRYLFGTGAGIDIVSYYDTVIRLEYSINREQDAGFFLHFKKEF